MSLMFYRACASKEEVANAISTTFGSFHVMHTNPIASVKFRTQE